MSDSDFLTIEKERRYDGMCLSRDIIPPNDYPMEESRRIESLIRQQESNSVEFKTSLTGGTRDDLDNRDKGLQFNDTKFRAMKATVGFLNSEGGELLIGIRDLWDGHEHPVVGIESDLRPFSDKRDPKDYYLQILDQLVNAYIGKIYDIRPSFWTIHNRTILRIKVGRSKNPAYLVRGKFGNYLVDKEYWVRKNVSNFKLIGQDIEKWRKSHGQF